MANNTAPTIQLPPQLSEIAPEIDNIYYFIFWVSVAFFIGIVGTMLVFLWRYRRQPGRKAEPTGHNDRLELFWTFSPLILLFVMFHWGFQTYVRSTFSPDDALNIRVTARQWAWEFEHPNGMTETNEVHLPAGRPVRLIMSSQDVIHSFFVPDFRVKRDVVPGMFSSLGFTAIERTDVEPEADSWYRVQVFCTEYCGLSHSDMGAVIHVQTEAQYSRFLEQGPTRPAAFTTDAQWGQSVFAQAGCPTCHSRDAGGPDRPGPNFHNMFGRQERLASGETVTIDAAYIRRSIMEPRAQIVAGYEPLMQPYRFSENHMNALVAYLETLQANPPAAPEPVQN